MWGGGRQQIRFSLYVYTDSTSKRCNKREATDASTVTVASKAGAGTGVDALSLMRSGRHTKVVNSRAPYAHPDEYFVVE